MDGTEALTRGELADRAGVGIETIRFYERKGLLEDPPRTPAGYRQYEERVVVCLKFIRRAKQLGFSLSEIDELLSLRLDPDTNCTEVERRAGVKLREVKEKIRDLERMAVSLDDLTDACNRTGGDGGCPRLARELVRRQYGCRIEADSRPEWSEPPGEPADLARAGFDPLHGSNVSIPDRRPS